MSCRLLTYALADFIVESCTSSAISLRRRIVRRTGWKLVWPVDELGSEGVRSAKNGWRKAGMGEGYESRKRWARVKASLLRRTTSQLMHRRRARHGRTSLVPFAGPLDPLRLHEAHEGLVHCLKLFCAHLARPAISPPSQVRPAAVIAEAAGSRAHLCISAESTTCWQNIRRSLLLFALPSPPIWPSAAPAPCRYSAKQS